jgi:hypothetical protein
MAIKETVKAAGHHSIWSSSSVVKTLCARVVCVEMTVFIVQSSFEDERIHVLRTRA